MTCDITYNPYAIFISEFFCNRCYHTIYAKTSQYVIIDKAWGLLAVMVHELSHITNVTNVIKKNFCYPMFDSLKNWIE